MARKHPAKITIVAASVVLSALFAGATALGQERPPAAAPPGIPAPFSIECQVANAAVIAQSPLPNVAAALRKRKVIRILAIGASATTGRSSDYFEQIEKILEKAVKGLDVFVVNRGISGELAADAEERIKIEVALTEPDLVLWQVGTNDALAYIPIGELRDTLVQTIRWLKRHKVDVVLVGLQFVHREVQDDHYRAVRELIRSVGRQEKVVVVRRSEAMRLIKQAAGSGDGPVPEEFARTEAGYACLAEYVARAIALGSFGSGLRDQPPRPGQSPAQPAPARP